MPETETNRATWEFLADTYWYVTPPDLTALQFSPDDQVLTWRGDQTVWHISGYKNGYFWGVTAAITFDPGDAGGTRAGRPRQLSLVGSVSPGGQVQITFIRGSRLSETITTGFGQMIRVGDAWAFQMHMSTASGTSQLLHWANMMQTREGDASWQQLPGVDCSVPDMLEGATYPQLAQ